MRKLLLYIFAFMMAGQAAAQCPGPAQRNALINLQRAIEVESTRAGQIPLTDTCGNQRYAQYVEVNPDTINYIPASSGNTQNLSEFVLDTLGQLWYIDWQGNSVQFASGGASCDTDWLQVSDNSCPDNILDSIYTQRYAAIGARLIFPGAELLVNDSTAAGLVVVQGSRNARLALYDGFTSTFTMIDHGGSAPNFYVPVDADLTFKTTGGTPQTPVGSQVNHFAINTSDSTIQMHQYPNSRLDTSTVENFLYTDAAGRVQSQSTANFPGLVLNALACGDTAASACTIYTAPASTLNLNYNSAGSQYGVRLNDNSAGLYLSSPNGSTYAQLTNTNFRGQYTLPGQLFIGSDDGNSWIQQTAAQANITGSGPINTYQFIGDTSGTVRMRSDYPTANWIGFLSTQKNVLDVRLNNAQPAEGQILQANANGYMTFADPALGGIYGSSGYIPNETYASFADTTNHVENAPYFVLGRGNWTNDSYDGTGPLNGIIVDDPNNSGCWWCATSIISSDTSNKAITFFDVSGTNSSMVSRKKFGANSRNINLKIDATNNAQRMFQIAVNGAGGSTYYIVVDSVGQFGIGDLDPDALCDIAGVTKTQKLVGQDLTPGITVDAAQAGTGASASITAAQSSDLAGRFSVTTGTGATTGRWATITFSSAYTITPIGVIGCEDSDCAGLGLYVNMSTTTMEIFITGSPADATTYEFAYHVIGGK